MDLQRGFVLGTWVVRPLENRLVGNEAEERLEPKAMDVLVELARHPGEVVTRNHLFDTVWAGTIVTDEVLSRCISLLRQQLGDDAKNPRFIQTIPRRGYRLMCSVGPLQTPPQPASAAPGGPGAAPTATRSPAGSRRLLAAAAGMVAVVVLAVMVLRGRDEVPPAPVGATDRIAIAVLPFTDLSEGGGKGWFSDGLSDEVMWLLSRNPQLDVVARSSTLVYRERPEDVREIARQLNVDHVLEGSVRQAGGRMRVSIQLIDADDGYQRWSESYERDVEDILSVQREIAQAVVASLPLAGKQINGPGPAGEEVPTSSVEAWQLFLRGRHQWKKRGAEPLIRSIELYRQAIELDPAFARAYLGLAGSYALLPYYSGEPEAPAFRQAWEAASQAVELDPQVEGEAEAVLAFLDFSRWNWLEARRRFAIAMERAPGNANLRQWHSQFLSSTGWLEESVTEAEAARALDAVSPVVNDRLAVAYLWAGDDEKAARQFAIAGELGLAPSANPEGYLIFLVRNGRLDEAERLLSGLLGGAGLAADWVPPVFDGLRDPAARPAARAPLARAASENLVPPRILFGALLLLGDAEGALALANRIIDSGDHRSLDVEFLFAPESAPLRRHPGFSGLVDRLGLADYWRQTGWPPMCGETAGRLTCE